MTLLLLATLAGTLQPMRSYDFWWHLASGKLLWNEGRIPTADPFSFTRAGTPWLDHEWLFQLLAYGAYQAGGWISLLLGTALLAVGTYWLLASSMSRDSRLTGVAWILLAVSLSGARFRFDFRPEMLSYLLLAAMIALLRIRRREQSRLSDWLFFPLFVLWANLHPGALLGAAVLILWLAGEWIQDWILREKPLRRAIGDWRAPACVAGVLINPGGYHLLLVPLKIRAIVQSGHAPNMEWLAPSFSDFPLFFGSVALALVSVAGGSLAALMAPRPAQEFERDSDSPLGTNPGVKAWRRWLRSSLGSVDLAPTLAIALLAWMAFEQLRNIAFFFLLFPLALERPLGALLDKGRAPLSTTRIAGAATLVLLTPVFLRQAPTMNEAAYLKRVAPEAAVQYLEKNRVGERLFNDVKFGGYLIWKRYPAHRVFIDGRNEIYDTLLSEVFTSLGSWDRWEAMLDRHQIDAAILRRGQLQAVQYPPAAPGSPPAQEMRAFSAAYFQREHWALVYWDDDALIFVRREESNNSQVLAEEYRLVNPDDVPHLVQEIRQGRVPLEDALLEVRRKLAESPTCLSAQALRQRLESLKTNPGS